MKKSILFLLLFLYAIPVWATSPTDTYREILMQNAATGTGNGTAITVDYFQTVSVEVTISATATITWEESITGLNWNTGSCVNASAPSTVVTTATTSGLYHCGLSALTQFRARISSYGSGTVTAYARITTLDFNKIRAAGSPGSIVVTQPTGSNLHVVCDSGCTPGGSFTDNSAFTFNTTAINNMGAVVDDVSTNTVAENSSGTPRMSTNRVLYTAPTTAGGTAFSMNTGVRDAGTQRVTIATNDVVPVTGTFWQATQPVSGTVTANQGGAPWSENIAQFGGTNVVTGTGTSGAGIPRVTVSNDSGILAAQSGAWTVTTTPPANATTNVAQFGNTNVSTGTGASGAGIPRVTVANDSNILVTQSGTWNIGTVTTLTGITNALPTGSNTLGAFTGTAADNSADSSLKLPVLNSRANAAAPAWTEGNQVPLSVDLAGNLRVNSTGGGLVDSSAFTLGTSTASPAGGVFNDAAAYLSTGTTGSVRITKARAFHDNLRDSAGQEVGTRTNPLIIDVNQATFGQPQSTNKLTKVFAQPSFLTGALGNRVGTVGDRLKVDPTPSADPCFSNKKTDVPISQTATSRLITAPQGGLSTYVCMIRVVAGAAEIVSEWEGTGTNCGTGTIAHSGSTTTANGESLAANGGFVSGDGNASVITIPAGKDFCLAQNGANRVSGTLTFVYGP